MSQVDNEEAERLARLMAGWDGSNPDAACSQFEFAQQWTPLGPVRIIGETRPLWTFYMGWARANMADRQSAAETPERE